jgi:hypothetical protein
MGFEAVDSAKPAALLTAGLGANQVTSWIGVSGARQLSTGLGQSAEVLR